MEEKCVLIKVFSFILCLLYSFSGQVALSTPTFAFCRRTVNELLRGTFCFL